MTRLSVVVLFVITLMTAAAASAQEPARPAGAGRQGGARPAPQPIPLFFKETWKDTATAVPATQAVVTNADLEFTLYGKGAEVNNEGGVPHVWTGLCEAACGVTLKSKTNYADLTGKSHIKWFAKTSGFHQIRPLLKLADGTMLVGDFADGYTYDYRTTEFFLAEVRWLKFDPMTLTTKGTLLPSVDLTKVDEIGVVDLTPGSGHGAGGWSDLGWIEVYGKPVAR